MADLAILAALSGKRKTQQQQYISLLLEEKGATLPDILSDIVIIAKTATKPTPTWEEIEDYKTRLSASKLLLEMSGDYVPSKASMNVSLWFSNLIYWNNNKDEPITEDVIQGE